MGQSCGVDHVQDVEMCKPIRFPAFEEPSSYREEIGVSLKTNLSQVNLKSFILSFLGSNSRFRLGVSLICCGMRNVIISFEMDGISRQLVLKRSLSWQGRKARDCMQCRGDG